MSDDGQRGDIDVDYESKNPLVLVPTFCLLHCTEMNSDVRADHHFETHNKKFGTGPVGPLRGDMNQRNLSSLRARAEFARRCSIIFLLLSFFATAVYAQSDADEVSNAAQTFFTSWLVERNISRASAYLSDDPVIGSCMSPRHVRNTATLPRKQIARVFLNVLTTTLRKLPKANTLGAYISSDGAKLVSSDDALIARHRHDDQYFIFALKPLHDLTDNGFVCKFDETTSFFKRISQPGEYYLYTTVKVTANYEPFILITVWSKEHGRWRIVTFSATTKNN